VVGAGGWRRIGHDPRIAAWAAAALPIACRAVGESHEEWRCGGTWFVGVDALPNGPDGAVGGVDFPWSAFGLLPTALHQAQVSVVGPGYPRPWSGEDEAAFGFRLRRDAAHLDGLLPVGPEKRRMVQEPHAWILGLPLNDCGAGASPLVVWEGSHLLMADALRRAFAGHRAAEWGQFDVTDAYRAARAEVFRTCRRIEVPVRPGEATLLHRHLIHGVAAWAEGAEAPAEGRMIAYFRPQMASVAEWIAPD
jgi:hypothetical protein